MPEYFTLRVLQQKNGSLNGSYFGDGFHRFRVISTAYPFARYRRKATIMSTSDSSTAPIHAKIGDEKSQIEVRISYRIIELFFGGALFESNQSR